MSHESNQLFYERVSEFIDEHEGMSYITKHAERLLEEERYEELAKFMLEVEADQSREHFHSKEILGAGDVY